MQSIAQRRPPRPGGDVPSQAAQPPGLVPSELPRAACPINPRPRNLREYQSACAGADGAPIQELDAWQVAPGMHAWSGGRFLPVVRADRMTVSQIPGLSFVSESARTHPFALIRLEGDGAAGWIVGELDTPVYCLA